MRAETRRQLKQDRFAATVAQEVEWASEHRRQLVIGGIVVAVVLALGLGWWWWNGQQDLKASAQLAEAIRTYTAPIVTPDQPPVPGQPSFNSAADRAKAALKLFADIENKYGSTTSGKVARYYTGLCFRDSGDIADAEKALKKSADDGDVDRAALAKFALAELYAAQSRNDDAVKAYNDLAAHPAASVSRSTALLTLAQFYEELKQPQQARDTYQQILKDDSKSQFGQYAQTRLAALGGAPAPQPNQPKPPDQK